MTGRMRLSSFITKAWTEADILVGERQRMSVKKVKIRTDIV